MVKLIGHLHFPDFHVYVSPIIKTAWEALSTIPIGLGLLRFLKGGQGDASSLYLKDSKIQMIKFQN